MNANLVFIFYQLVMPIVIQTLVIVLLTTMLYQLFFCKQILLSMQLLINTMR